MWYQIFKDKTDEVFERYKQKNAVTYMLDNGDTVDFDFGKIHNVFIEFSNIMKKYGIVQGDRIAILTPHSPYGVITGYAAVYNNVTIALVDAAISSDEIRRLIKLADVKAIFTTQLLSSIFTDNTWENIPIINIEKTVHQERRPVYMANILPVSDLRNYNEVLKNCHKGEPVYLTKNGRGRFVVMDIEDYERDRAEKKLLLKLQEAEEAVKDGDGWLNLDELKALMGE